MGFRAAQYVFNREWLEREHMVIMQRAGWSCIDNTGWLPFDRGWLAWKTKLSERSLKRYLPQLAKLEELVPGAGGFRLSAFLRDQCGATNGANLAQKKESTKERKEFCLSNWENPPTPLAGGQNRITRFARKRARAAADFGGFEGLRTFTEAHCSWCVPPHEWQLSEVYSSESQPQWMCPEFRKVKV